MFCLEFYIAGPKLSEMLRMAPMSLKELRLQFISHKNLLDNPSPFSGIFCPFQGLLPQKKKSQVLDQLSPKLLFHLSLQSELLERIFQSVLVSRSFNPLMHSSIQLYCRYLLGTQDFLLAQSRASLQSSFYWLFPWHSTFLTTFLQVWVSVFLSHLDYSFPVPTASCFFLKCKDLISGPLSALFSCYSICLDGLVPQLKLPLLYG